MNIYKNSVVHINADTSIFHPLSFLCATSFFATVVYLTFKVLNSYTYSASM